MTEMLIYKKSAARTHGNPVFGVGMNRDNRGLRGGGMTAGKNRTGLILIKRSYGIRSALAAVKHLFDMHFTARAHFI